MTRVLNRPAADGNVIREGEASKGPMGRAETERVPVATEENIAREKAENVQAVRLGALVSDACGVVNSGMPDLASNPAHLAGFGRDADRSH